MKNVVINPVSSEKLTNELMVLSTTYSLSAEVSIKCCKKKDNIVKIGLVRNDCSGFTFKRHVQ